VFTFIPWSLYFQGKRQQYTIDRRFCKVREVKPKVPKGSSVSVKYNNNNNSNINFTNNNFHFL
jgi:hypothetical protein